MAAERSDRERFSHREAYERWTGDYWEKADNADEPYIVIAPATTEAAQQRLADACLALAARIRREMPWPGDCRGAATVLENTAGDLRAMVEEVPA